MSEAYTPDSVKNLYDTPYLGRQGDIGDPEKEVLENARDSFVLEYPKMHPAENFDIQTAERTLEHMAKISLPPVGWFRNPSHTNGNASYGSFYGNFPDSKRPEIIQVSSDPKTKIRANFSDNSVNIEQGSLFTALRWSGMYFLHTKTATVAQALNFQNPGETPIHDFFNDPSVVKQLFPSYTPYHERPATQKGIGELNLMVTDIRTKLPTGERGLLRSGFVTELAYKYLTAKESFGKRKVDGVLSVLRGDGDMGDYYTLFKGYQSSLQKEFPQYTKGQINALAAEKTLPTDSRLGFTEKRVVELPERKMVVVSSLQPKQADLL